MTQLPYVFLDSGNQQRLEKFGEYTLIRPCSQAVWKPRYAQLWEQADALFTREEGNKWMFYKKVPSEWNMLLGGLVFKISPTDFGHLGIFPEHHEQWKWIEALLHKRSHKTSNVLNLFAYSGAASVKLVASGAKVCHVDSSKKSVSWAADNAALNGMDEGPIRWIVDDAIKFLQREVRRGSQYDAIILDPPSFGKGAKGEVFKIESDISLLLELCQKVLVQDPLFVLFTCHTPGFTPSVMKYLLTDMMGSKGCIESGEMLINSKTALPLPSGVFARWSAYG